MGEVVEAFERRVALLALCVAFSLSGCSSDGFEYQKGNFSEFQQIARARSGPDALDCGTSHFSDASIAACMTDALAREQTAYAFFIGPNRILANSIVLEPDGAVTKLTFSSPVPEDGEVGERAYIAEFSCIDPGMERIEGRDFDFGGGVWCREVVQLAD